MKKLTIATISIVVGTMLIVSFTKRSPPAPFLPKVKAISSKKAPVTLPATKTAMVKTFNHTAAKPLDHAPIIPNASEQQVAEDIATSWLSKHMHKPFNKNLPCTKSANCPVPLAEFYARAFGNLKTANSSYKKALLQEALLASDMPLEAKQQLLQAELVSPEIRDIKPTSARDSSGHGQPGADVMYLLATQNRLFFLNPDVNYAISSSLAAIENTQDIVGRIMLSASLLGRYPQRANDIMPEVNALGVNSEMLQAVARGIASAHAPH